MEPTLEGRLQSHVPEENVRRMSGRNRMWTVVTVLGVTIASGTSVAVSESSNEARLAGR